MLFYLVQNKDESFSVELAPYAKPLAKIDEYGNVDEVLNEFSDKSLWAKIGNASSKFWKGELKIEDGQNMVRVKSWEDEGQ